MFTNTKTSIEWRKNSNKIFGHRTQIAKTAKAPSLPVCRNSLNPTIHASLRLRGHHILKSSEISNLKYSKFEIYSGANYSMTPYSFSATPVSEAKHPLTCPQYLARHGRANHLLDCSDPPRPDGGEYGDNRESCATLKGLDLVGAGSLLWQSSSALVCSHPDPFRETLNDHSDMPVLRAYSSLRTLKLMNTSQGARNTRTPYAAI
jgi:hypothetical protein